MGDFECRPAILRVARRLACDGTRQATVEEVAEAAHVTVGQVRRVLSPPRLESIDQGVGDSGATLGDALESPEVGPENEVIAGLALSALQTVGLAALDRRELFVIVRRFGLDGEPEARLVDIGASLGLSREAVRQIEAKAIAKIRHPMVLCRLQRYGKE
jgi:RNA polymerase primary sigma factor/RNA polymerase nonessential primary-like sigma factor